MLSVAPSGTIDRQPQIQAGTSISQNQTPLPASHTLAKTSKSMSPASKAKNIALCTSCRSLFDLPHVEWIDDHRSASKYRMHLKWHDNFNSLSESVRAGCELCQNVSAEMIIRGLSGHGQDIEKLGTSIEADITETTRQVGRAVMLDWDVRFTAVSSHDKPGYRVASAPFGIHHFRAHTGSPLDHEELMSLSLDDGNEIPTTRDLSVARDWLGLCSHHHGACGKRARKSNILPSRLVHMYYKGGNLAARLVEAEYIPAECSYVTLSHCWGSGPLQTLNADNHAALKTDVISTNLPQTFLHAFEVALQLGFSYIWIDSLCIIQDSDDDWSRECQKMAEVYENAAMNIAATTFLDSDTGLYVTKLAKRPRTISVEVDVISPQVKDSPQHHLEGTYDLFHEDAWSVRVDQAPLNCRGWVLQERFFSSRILHFGKDQLLWECQQLQASETFASVYHPPIRSERTAGSRPYQTLMEYMSSRDQRAAAATSWEQKDALKKQIRQETMWTRDTWYSIVETYSNAHLTRTSDKLVAIGGIISKFQYLLDDTCISGMWYKSIMHDLLWYRTEGQSRQIKRPDKARAPSWSWACLDYHVTYSERRYPPDLIFDDRAELLGHDVTTGTLRLRAPILRRQTRDDWTRTGDWLQIIEGRRANEAAIVRYDAISSDLGVSLEAPPAYYPHSIGAHKVYILCITKEPYAAGLLLRRSGPCGHYSRIGYFGNVRDMRGLQGSSYSMVQDDYIDKHRGNTYTIALS